MAALNQDRSTNEDQQHATEDSSAPGRRTTRLMLTVMLALLLTWVFADIFLWLGPSTISKFLDPISMDFSTDSVIPFTSPSASFSTFTFTTTLTSTPLIPSMISSSFPSPKQSPTFWMSSPLQHTLSASPAATPDLVSLWSSPEKISLSPSPTPTTSPLPSPSLKLREQALNNFTEYITNPYQWLQEHLAMEQQPFKMHLYDCPVAFRSSCLAEPWRWQWIKVPIRQTIMWETLETQKRGRMLGYTGSRTGNETRGADWRVEQIERPSVLEIPDAYVLPTGVVMVNHTYIWDLAPRTCKHRELNPQPGVPLLVPPIDLYGNPCKRAADGHSLYVTVQWWGKAYYHSFIEQASRLAPFQERIFKNNHTHPFSLVTILRPNIYYSMATYALNLLGLENKPVMLIEQQYEECASASVVLLPSSHGCSQPNAIAIRLFRKQLREELLHQVVPTATLFTRRPILVIKRPHGWKRSVTNFYEFLSALRNRFEPQEHVVVHYGTESVRDQALMFYQAKLIVGPHGAGMSNVLFSPDDVKLVEVWGQPDNDLGFVDLASKLGIEHHVIVCAPYINSSYMIKFDVNRILFVVEQALRNPYIPAPTIESSVES